MLCSERAALIAWKDSFGRFGRFGTPIQTLDVASLKDVQAFAGFALETHGRIDVVVNMPA